MNIRTKIDLEEPLLNGEIVENSKSALEKLHGTLHAMALVGIGGEMIAAMLELGTGVHGLPKIAGYRLKFLRGPIICHSRERALDGHPIRENPAFKNWITADRLKWTMGLTELPVGPAEIAMIMYEASLEAPLNDRMAELYIWATQTAMYRINPENLEMLKSVNGKFPPDGPPEQILDDPTMKMEYFRFVNEIQRKVENNCK
jgi:hypothetical protein